MSDLADRVAQARWYHTIELADGIVTEGEYDLRPTARRLPIPESLAGMRCLDVGTRDGFWAFEMERRGAAEVVGIDLDDPRDIDWPQPPPQLDGDDEIERRSRTFALAKEALGSRVERRDLSVYRLDPAEVGEFDFVFLGTLLLHLRDPIGALTAVRRVTRGQLLLNEVISLPATVLRPRVPTVKLMEGELPFWGIPNAAALRRYLRAAGFEVLRSSRPYLERNGTSLPPGRLQLRSPVGSLPTQLILRAGAPHVWLLARPR